MPSARPPPPPTPSGSRWRQVTRFCLMNDQFPAAHSSTRYDRTPRKRSMPMSEKAIPHEKVGDVVITEIEVVDDSSGKVRERFFVLRTRQGVQLQGTYATKQAVTAAAQTRFRALQHRSRDKPYGR
jgi:hypothetical protein